jgi:hypothetical protein
VVVIGQSCHQKPRRNFRLPHECSDRARAFENPNNSPLTDVRRPRGCLLSLCEFAVDTTRNRWRCLGSGVDPSVGTQAPMNQRVHHPPGDFMEIEGSPARNPNLRVVSSLRAIRRPGGRVALVERGSLARAKGHRIVIAVSCRNTAKAEAVPISPNAGAFGIWGTLTEFLCDLRLSSRLRRYRCMQRPDVFPAPPRPPTSRYTR